MSVSVLVSWDCFEAVGLVRACVLGGVKVKAWEVGCCVAKKADIWEERALNRSINILVELFVFLSV